MAGDIGNYVEVVLENSKDAIQLVRKLVEHIINAEQPGDRAIVWTPRDMPERATLYMSKGACMLAENLGFRLIRSREIPAEDLPMPRVLLVGDFGDLGGPKRGREWAPVVLEDLGYCYTGTGCDPNTAMPLAILTQAECRQAGGKSWLVGGACINL
jgi:hypothetical protein